MPLSEGTITPTLRKCTITTSQITIRQILTTITTTPLGFPYMSQTVSSKFANHHAAFPRIKIVTTNDAA